MPTARVWTANAETYAYLGDSVYDPVIGAYGSIDRELSFYEMYRLLDYFADKYNVNLE